ncbi:MAG: hypothetical protein COB04_12930 [Gammaproteobacteria bacterium]|nr:MAG: hypothetical protein COB04_12930 [Gammaproteobacteria bacterium]
MKAKKSMGVIIALFVTFSFLQGCSSHDPVAVSECPKVVKHAQKILGAMAPKRSQMVDDCKKASDSDRGCIMAATTKGQVAQCM